MGEVVLDQWRILLAKARKFLLHLLKRFVGHLIQIDKAGAGAFHAAQELIELERHDPRVPVLAVLDEKYQQERDDGRAGIDDELPSVRVAEERARDAPD